MEDRLSFAWSAAQRTVSAGRIGTPVALRLVDYGQADEDRLLARLASQADQACKLLAAEPALVWARRTTGGPIDVQIRGSRGESMLLSTGAMTRQSPMAALTVIGQRGIASWGPDREPHVVTRAAEPERWSQGGELLRTISTSIETGEACWSGTPQAGAERPQTLSVATVPATCRAAAIGPPPWGVLLVSGGQTHQEMYAPAFAADPRCRLVGLADEASVTPRRKALNAELAQSLGIPLLASLDEALGRDDVQIVSVCAEPERRAAVISRVAAAGKHLYLDKPLAASIDEASRLRAQIRSAGIYSQMFSLVHTSAAQRVQALGSGQLGELLAVHCDLFFAKGPAGTAQLGQRRRENPRPTTFEAIDSKRELYNIGVYPLALLVCMLRRRVRRVFATTGNYFFAEHQRNNMEDFAQAWFEFDGGVAATICVGRTGWHSHPSGGVQRTYLIGTHGTACVDAHNPRLEVWTDEPAWQTPQCNPEDPMGFWVSTQRAVSISPKSSWLIPSDDHTDVRHFLDCLAGGRDSCLAVDDAADALEGLLAAYQSAAIGQPVTIAR